MKGQPVISHFGNNLKFLLSYDLFVNTGESFLKTFEKIGDNHRFFKNGLLLSDLNLNKWYYFLRYWFVEGK